MKNRVSTLIKTTMCILLIMCLSGCWNRRELDTLGIVMGIGIDKSVKPGKIRVTAQIVKPAAIKLQGKQSGGTSSEAFWNVSGTGNTVFGTLRDMTSKSSRKLFFPHNQVIIFDKSLAKAGLQKYLDFFMRDPETRVDVLVLISQTKATDILNQQSDMENIPANNIAELINGYASATSQTRAVMLRDLIPGLMSKTMASTIPFIKVLKNGNQKIVAISGTGVFKVDKLVGSLNKAEGRGLMWVLGKIKSGILEVPDFRNNIVSLEIIRAGSKIAPKLNNNKITIKISINEEGNVGEQTGPENLVDLAAIASLEKKASEAIKNEVQASVKKAKKLDADIFGFGEAVHKKYPKQWKVLEKNWDKKFKTIHIEIDAKAKLRLMGREIIPTVPKPKKEKK